MRIIFSILLLNIFYLLSQENIIDSLEHQDLKRYFTVHLPPKYESSEQNPLVIFLHGGNGNMLSAQGSTRFNQVSNKNSFVIVYPQGYVETEEDSYIWADGRNTRADQEGINDVGFINKLVDSLIIDFRINPKRIYICGFSNGSFLTQRIAFQGNSKFAAMGTLGGTMQEEFRTNRNPGKAIPMIYIFGEADPFVPYNGGPVAGTATKPVSGILESVEFWRNNNNCRDELEPIDVENKVKNDNSTVRIYEYGDCDCDANVKYYEVLGAGHTWPGVELEDYEEIAGETNEDINASEELWKFFNKYELCLTNSIVKNEFQFDLYPNPAREILLISGVRKGEGVEIKDTNGRVIAQLTANSENLSFFISNLDSGLYFVRSGKIIRKFIKY